MEKFNVKSSSQQMPSFLQAIGAVAPRQSSGSNQRSGANQSSTTTVYHMQGSSRPITSNSLGHHQLLSDSTFQGGKTVHHMGQSNITKTKIKEPAVVKIEVGLNPTTQKKQRRSSSSGDGPTRLGSETTSRDLIFPPVKKIKLEIGDAGIWETKKESEESLVSGVVGSVGSKDGLNYDYDEEDDDVCPVDYKSRCVILLEEQMQNIVKNFKACAMELYYLENDGDILDYSNWLKKPNPHLGDYLDKTATQHDMSIRGIESEEARIFTSGSGTLPTITPVAISKKLPPAIAALQQKQMESSESHTKRFVGGFHSVVYGRVQPQPKNTTTAPLAPGGIPLSTTAATTTIGSPTPLNTSCNENASSSSKTTSLVTGTPGLGSNHGILVRPIPIVAVPSSSAGLLADPDVPSHSLVHLDSVAIVTAASVVTTSVISSTRLTSPFHGTNHVQSTQEATVELAKQEAKVLSRVADLRKQGLWTLNRLPKILEPERSKSHWDMLLKEMEWMAVDFAQERRWKITCSATIACSVIRSEAITKRNARRRREEKRKIDMASYMARVVEEFWHASQEEYLFKNYHDMEKDCKQVLESILATTSKVYLESERNLISNIDPNLCHAASESDESDDREQEIKDLLSSAEWPIDNVFKQFYPKMFTERDQVCFDDANCQTKSYEGCNVSSYESSRDDGAAGDFEPLHYSDPSLSDTNLDLFKGELKELQSVGPGKDLIEADRTVRKYTSLDEFLSDIPIMNNDEVNLDLLHNGLFCAVTGLRPYQVSSAARLSKFWLQGIPFMEVRDAGLGTKLLLAFHFSTLAFNYHEWGCHLIVIKEKRDLFSWRASFAKFAPSLRVKVAVDLKEGFDNFFINSSIEDAAENFNVLVTCYDHFRQHIMIYEKFNWKTLVLDKVADLCSSNISFNTFSYLNHNHLVMFFDAEAVPSEAFRLLPQNGKDEDDGRMDCLTILSEPFMELIGFVLKENISDFDHSGKNDCNWQEELTSQIASKNISALPFTMDEAANVFRMLCSCVTKKKVVNQLQTLNILTLASTLPAKQALTYNEGFGALLEESPEVTSPEFLHQVNELYNTCAHLDVFHLLTDQFSCLKDSMNSYFFPTSLLDISKEKMKDHSLPTSLKHLLTLYSWGVGLIEETTGCNSIVNDVFPTSNVGEIFEWKSARPYSPNLLRSLTSLVSGHQGDSRYDRFDSVRKIMDKIDNDKLLDIFPREIDHSLQNIVFMVRPLKTNFAQKDFDNQTFDSTGSMGMVKEEMMDYSYEDGSQTMGSIDACGLDNGEVFDALGSDCLKELTSIGKRCFEEDLHKFLISFKMVISQLLDVTLKRSSRSGAKKLIVPLIDTIDRSIEEIRRKNIDYIDRKIIGCNKGKLSSLSMLLEKERQMSEGRFVVLTCHNQTLSSIQGFLCRRGFTYVSIDSNADVSQVRKQISKFNFNKKYDCLVIQHSDALTWKSFVHILGPDALPLARNLIVLDEELPDIKKPSGILMWQLLAKKMSASNDLNLVRLYHKNTIEGYQVHRRWSKEAIDNLFGEGKFDCQLGTFQQIESSTDNVSEFQIFKGKDLSNDDIDYVRMDDEDIDDLDFIYSSHQDSIRVSYDEVLPQLCSCLDEPLFASDDINEEEKEIDKQNEVRSYAMEVIGRQLKCSETILQKKNQTSCFKTDKLIQIDWDNEVDYDISLSDVQPYEDLLTYEVDYLEPECFISDLTGEKMPVWAPPIPPQDDDVFLDRNILLLYESIPMSETQLPNLYIRKGNKRSKIDDSYARSTKTLGRDAKHDSSLPNLQRPRSLFERPTAISQPNTIPLSTASSLAYGFQIDRDGRLINKAGIPVGQPYARSPTVPIPIPRPNPESQGDQVDWLVHEEWALLQAYQMTCQEGNPLQDSLNQPPPQSRLPNWELIACIVNGFGRVFRSARQCRLRYENVILPREEGRSHFDNGQRKFKKTSKGLYKTKSNRQLKTIQMYSQDSNRSLMTHLSLRFDLLKNFLGKKHLRKIAAATAAQAGKTNHVAFMLEHNISYDRPLSPIAIAEMKLERVNKEKEKRTVTALPDRLQQTLTTTAPSSNPVNAVLNVQQQQPQQPPSEAVAATVTPISTSLTVPLGAQVSFVLPNSQLRMAVPGVASNQQQQQVILQAAVAQQQMAIVASAASNSMLGKVPLVSGVNNSLPAVRNLTNLSFVVNQSAAANQQSTTFVTVSKAQGAVVSTVGIVTSLSPAAIKAIRNINPAAVSQLASSINIGQNKAMPSATAVSFPPGIIQNNRIAIRGPGTIQLNQRLTQKPATSQQQVTLTAGTNMAGIQKLSSVGVVSVPTTQTFHVKNPQVVLKSKQQPTGAPQQQLSGATVVSRLAAATSNQGPSLQFQHLQIQSKTPLLEVMQQQQLQSSSSSAQQILTTNFTSAPVSGMNVTTLIKSVSANSNLGKVVTPTQTAIRQSQVAKRPTVTAINIQGQGNRTALLGIQQVTKGTGSSQVIYQQPKLVLQPQGVVKQQPGVQLQQGSAILAMTSRGNTVNISAIGLASTIATGNGMAIPINQTCLAQGVMGSGQPVRVAKQMINAAKVAPLVQHITVRASQQQQQQISQLSAASTSATSTASIPIIRPQNPPSSS